MLLILKFCTKMELRFAKLQSQLTLRLICQTFPREAYIPRGRAMYSLVS